jgi:hypothetical protein
MSNNFNYDDFDFMLDNEIEFNDYEEEYDSAITSRLYVHSAQEPLQSAANALQALLH